MTQFSDMRKNRLMKPYKNLNPSLVDVIDNLYEVNKTLPGKDQLSEAQLKQFIDNQVINSYAGLNLENEKQNLSLQENVMQEAIEGLHSFGGAGNPKVTATKGMDATAIQELLKPYATAQDVKQEDSTGQDEKQFVVPIQKTFDELIKHIERKE